MRNARTDSRTPNAPTRTCSHPSRGGARRLRASPPSVRGSRSPPAPPGIGKRSPHPPRESQSPRITPQIRMWKRRRPRWRRTPTPCAGLRHAASRSCATRATPCGWRPPRRLAWPRRTTTENSPSTRLRLRRTNGPRRRARSSRGWQAPFARAPRWSARARRRPSARLNDARWPRRTILDASPSRLPKPPRREPRRKRSRGRRGNARKRRGASAKPPSPRRAGASSAPGRPRRTRPGPSPSTRRRLRRNGQSWKRRARESSRRGRGRSGRRSPLARKRMPLRPLWPSFDARRRRRLVRLTPRRLTRKGAASASGEPRRGAKWSRPASTKSPRMKRTEPPPYESTPRSAKRRIAYSPPSEPRRRRSACASPL